MAQDLPPAQAEGFPFKPFGKFKLLSLGQALYSLAKLFSAKFNYHLGHLIRLLQEKDTLIQSWITSWFLRIYAFLLPIKDNLFQLKSQVLFKLASLSEIPLALAIQLTLLLPAIPALLHLWQAQLALAQGVAGLPLLAMGGIKVVDKDSPTEPKDSDTGLRLDASS